MKQGAKTYSALIFMLILITLPSISFAQERIEDRLVGTYKLILLETRKSSGEVVPGPLGDKPNGILIYNNKGFMCANVMRTDRPKVASRDPQDIMKAFDGYVGYCGRYSVNEKERTVTHHITIGSIPDWIGDQKRFFELSGKQLTLRTGPIIYGGQTESMENRLIWERMD
jgi:hypothetical protein